MKNLVRVIGRSTVSLMVVLLWLPAMADAAGQEKARAADTGTETDRVNPALLSAGKERSARKLQGEKRGAYALEDGQTVPADRLDGGIAERTSAGGVFMAGVLP